MLWGKVDSRGVRHLTSSLPLNSASSPLLCPSPSLPSLPLRLRMPVLYWQERYGLSRHGGPINDWGSFRHVSAQLTLSRNGVRLCLEISRIPITVRKKRTGRGRRNIGRSISGLCWFNAAAILLTVRVFYNVESAASIILSISSFIRCSTIDYWDIAM